MRSVMTFLIVALAACFALVAASPFPAGGKREYPFKPVRWRTKFSAGSIEADRMYELEWEGGSGDYEVYYIPQWAGHDDYASLDIVKTSARSTKWRAPPIGLYPEGTTFILVVNDAHSGVGSSWYDTSSIMPFVSSD